MDPAHATIWPRSRPCRPSPVRIEKRTQTIVPPRLEMIKPRHIQASHVDILGKPASLSSDGTWHHALLIKNCHPSHPFPLQSPHRLSRSLWSWSLLPWQRISSQEASFFCLHLTGWMGKDRVLGRPWRGAEITGPISNRSYPTLSSDWENFDITDFHGVEVIDIE